MFLKPMQILKMIIVGSLLMYTVSRVLTFYGSSSSSYGVYISFFLFLLFSTAILDLNVPSVD